MGETDRAASYRMECAKHSLELLCLVCDRFSHATRTHLGVALGVFQDLLNGHDLTEQDYRDGSDALRAIVQVLDSVRVLSNHTVHSPTRESLFKVLSEEFAAGRVFGRESLSFQSIGGEKSPDRLYDRTLLCRALGCLCRYAHYRMNRFPADESGIVRIVYSLVDGDSETLQPGYLREVIEPSLNHAALGQEEAWGKIRSLRQVVEYDHCSESLGLLLAEQVFMLYGADVRVEADAARILFRMRF